MTAGRLGIAISIGQQRWIDHAPFEVLEGSLQSREADG
jgi:hypothetical protein